jgi:hypothetical protein
LGIAIAGAGDVNGDGIDDALACAPSFATESRGRAYAAADLRTLFPQGGGDGSQGFEIISSRGTVITPLAERMWYSGGSRMLTRTRCRHDGEPQRDRARALRHRHEGTAACGRSHEYATGAGVRTWPYAHESSHEAKR